MKIVSVVSLKGGTGKTTVAMSLAVAAEADGQSVLLIGLEDYRLEVDLDRWAKTRGNATPAVRACRAEELEDEIAWAKQCGFDLVILDVCCGFIPVTAAVGLADFVLIPTRVASLDVSGAVPAVNLVREARKPSAVVVTFYYPAEARELQEMGLEQTADICPVRMQLREQYVLSYRAGRSIAEFDPEGGGAAEVEELYRYIKLRLAGEPGFLSAA